MLELAKAGILPRTIVSSHGNLANALIALPKPTAVMAIHDMEAANVIETCRQIGLKVPDQVAVIGDVERASTRLVPPARA